MQTCEKSSEQMILDAIRSVYAEKADEVLARVEEEVFDDSFVDDFDHADTMAGLTFGNAADQYKDVVEQIAIILVKTHANGYVSTETSDDQRFKHYLWLFEGAQDERSRTFLDCLITLQCSEQIDLIRKKIESACLVNWSKEDYRDRIQAKAQLVLDEMLLKLGSDIAAHRSSARKFIEEGSFFYGKTIGDYLADARVDADSYFHQVDCAIERFETSKRLAAEALQPSLF